MTLVAITQRVAIVPEYGERRDCLDQAWPRFLAACGLAPLALPNVLEVALELCAGAAASGLVLTGGNDLAACGGDAPERDAVEFALLDWAERRGLPVLGVHNLMISGISTINKNTDDFCARLEEDFCDFKAFADGDPGFFADRPGPRFVSFREYVEETELFIECATLALRLEDFTVDPVREFSKIVKAMSVDLDLSRLHLAPPNRKLYRYLAVKEKVPRFRDVINGLDVETRRRIEKCGFEL